MRAPASRSEKKRNKYLVTRLEPVRIQRKKGSETQIQDTVELETEKNCKEKSRTAACEDCSEKDNKHETGTQNEGYAG